MLYICENVICQSNNKYQIGEIEVQIFFSYRYCISITPH